MIDEKTLDMLLAGTWDTIYMTLAATFFSYVFGILMGVILTITRKGGICPHAVVYSCLDVVVNVTTVLSKPPRAWAPQPGKL